MIGTLFIFTTALSESAETHSNYISPIQEVLSDNPLTKPVYNPDINYLLLPDSKRSLATYYDNRAFPGAPPSIPHPLLSEKGIGGKTCLQCHEKGGYTQQFAAFAPVTPHPDWINCKQCHVANKNNRAFSQTTWQKPAPPSLGMQALETSPNVIPHDLQYRENCLACHAGPAAPKEIRVSHPERVNCLQCHVTAQSKSLFASHGETNNQ